MPPSNPIRSIGLVPSTEVQFLGSLMWSDAESVRHVLRHVEDDDLEDLSARIILLAIRLLIASDSPHDGTAVGDHLQRSGALGGAAGGRTKKLLVDAITSGSHISPISYARAVVSDAYRRRFELLGKALVEAADTMPEDDLLPLLRQAGTGAVAHSKRLAALRGEAAA